MANFPFFTKNLIAYDKAYKDSTESWNACDESICKNFGKNSVLIGKIIRMDMRLICEYAARTVQKLA